MEKIAIFFIQFTLSIGLTNLIAQSTTIYTPKGSIVPDTYMIPEFSASQIEAGNNYVTQNYPLATILSDASATYNCHAYAWYLSEGNSPNVWIGNNTTTAEDIFWTDGSYTSVLSCQSYPEKVSYTSDNHSAITTPTTDIFKSKWGQLPLMLHNKNYTPYNSTSLVYYLRTPSILGPSLICTSSSYTVNNLSPNATVVWSSSNPSGLSINSTTGIATRQNNFIGQITITATIYVGVCNVSLQQNVVVGGYTSSDYTLTVSGSINGYLPWCSNKTYSFAISNSTPGATSSNFNWTIPQGWSQNYISGYLCVLRSPSGNYPPTGNISVSFTDNCGNTINRSMFLAYSCAYTRVAISTFPNPSSSTMTVQVEDSLATKNDALPQLYQLSLRDRNGMQVFSTQSDKSTIEIPISHLPQGIYYVHLIYGEAVLRRQVVIAH